MKNLFYGLLLTSFMIQQTVKCQVSEHNSIDINLTILKNSVSNQTSGLIIEKNNFISIFGNPSSSNNHISEIDGLTYFKTVYLGSDFWFVNNQLEAITFKNNSFEIIYNYNILKVGNNINTLHSLFPISFSGRRNNQIFVSIKNQNVTTDSFLVFNYDGANVITEINIQ